MADNNNVFTAVDQAAYDYYGDGTSYSDCWTYPKEKIDELVGDSLNGIETAKEEAIAAVQEAGSDAVQEIEAQGEETLDSIPDDYTQLSEDVSELKEDLNQIQTDLTDEIYARESADTAINTALSTKAEIDGYYDGMTVGDAEQLVSTVYVEDSAPYNFRTAGGDTDIV